MPPAVALGHVLPARAAHAGGDLAPHEGEAGAAAAPAAPKAEAGPAARPSCHRPSATSTWRGAVGEVATAHLLVKYAVRYKGLDEAVGVQGVAPLGGDAGRHPRGGAHRGGRGVRDRPTAPAGLRYLDLPAWLASAGAKGIEKALKERLDDQLAVTVFRDPVTKTVSTPGETREAFAARVAGGGDAAEKLRQKLEKKRADLAVREQEVAGRKQEKWLAIGSAVLSNIGLLTGRKRSVSGVGSVLSKNRMEGTAEARLEALRAEVAELERQLAETTAVDPARLVEESLAPVRGGVGLLRYDLIWVH